MRAEHIVEDYLAVGPDDDAFEVVRLVAQRGLPGVVVADADGRLHAVLGPPDVLRLTLPRAVQESSGLARVYDEQLADRIAGELAGRPVGDILRDPPDGIPLARGRATAVELAETMARLRSPLVVVRQRDHTVGVITATCLLRRLVSEA